MKRKLDDDAVTETPSKKSKSDILQEINIGFIRIIDHKEDKNKLKLKIMYKNRKGKRDVGGCLRMKQKKLKRKK